jgi:hypothetical protein
MQMQLTIEVRWCTDSARGHHCHRHHQNVLLRHVAAAQPLLFRLESFSPVHLELGLLFQDAPLPVVVAGGRWWFGFEVPRSFIASLAFRLSLSFFSSILSPSKPIDPTSTSILNHSFRFV